jgi:hypothetical protein
MKAITRKAEEMNDRMTARGFSENDLPMECLTSIEQEKLLAVSLAYEKILLPATYILGGEKRIKNQFLDFSKKNKFCSVDFTVLNDPEWNFLFE